MINDKGETQYQPVSEQDMDVIRRGMIAEGFSAFQAGCVSGKEYKSANGSRIIMLRIKFEGHAAIASDVPMLQALSTAGHVFVAQFQEQVAGFLPLGHLGGKVIITEDVYKKLKRLGINSHE